MSSFRELVLLQRLNVVVFVVTIIVNGLATSVGLNGVTTADVSDMYFTLVTPAGYVFAIWSVIYTLLLLFSFFKRCLVRGINRF